MNIYKIFVFSFFILILSLGMVSADDNITSIDSDVNNELISDYNYSIAIPDDFSDMHVATVGVGGMPKDASGNVSIAVDENEVYNQKVSPGGNFKILNELNLTDGIHSSIIKYSGDVKYTGFVENITFEKTFMSLPFEGTGDIAQIQLRRSDDPIFYVEIDYGVTGNLKVYIDNKLVLNKNCNDDRFYYVNANNLTYGIHSYQVSYNGGNHKNQVKKGSFDLSYLFTATPEYTNITIGDSLEFYVDFVDDASLKYNVKMNGATKKYYQNFIELSDFKPGENIVEFSAKYNSVTKKIPVTIYVSPDLKVPETIYYRNTESIKFGVDDTTKGKLDIKVDGNEYKTADIRSAKTEVPLENLTLGKHSVTIGWYDENGKLMKEYEKDVNVIPYVETRLWIKDLDGIAFKAPEEIDGILKVTGMVNEDVEVKNGSALIPVGKIYSGKHNLEITYNDTTWKYNITAYKDSPDWEIQVNYREKIHGYEWMQELELQEYPYEITNMPDGLTGTLTVYQDGEYEFKTSGFIPGGFEIEPKFGKPGKHTVTFVYSGDDYFKACNKTVSYTLTDFMDVYFKDYTAYVKLPYDASGTLTLYINGKTYESKKLKVDREYSEDGIRRHYFDLDNLKKDKTYDIKIVYSGNYGKSTVKAKFKVDYDIELLTKSATYNENPKITFKVPFDIKNKATVTIDGVKFPYTEDDFEYNIDVSSLKPGVHNITITYPGDTIYPSKTVKDTITIDSQITTPEYDQYKLGTNIKVAIVLPDDATGNLIVEIDNKPYSSAAIKDGKAEVMLPSKEIDKYNYYAYYDGNYDTEPVSGHMSLVPKLTHTGNSKYTKNGQITVDMGSDLNATLVIFAQHIPVLQFEIKNNATIVIDKELLEPTKIIAQTIANSRADGDNYAQLDFTATLYVNNTEIISKQWYCDYSKKLDVANLEMTYNDGSVFKIKAYDLFGNAVGSGEKITVKIGTQKYNLETDSNGIASLKIKLAPETYTAKVSYGNLQVTKKITVKHALTLSKVTVKKSAKKLVLTAKINKKLKGQKITFKFNGKKYVVKTNSKGIAKATVKSSVLKKLKVGKKIKYQATYLKDTVKISVKVKK